MAFNAAQQEAIDADGNLSILAPPGSGKTGTLVAKAARVLREKPNAVVYLVTFTDAATKELDHRLRNALNADQYRRTVTATFHKHLMTQLRAANMLPKLIYPPEAATMLQRAIVACNRKMTIEEAQRELEAAKMAETFTGDESDLIENYEQQKRRHRAIDLLDVVRLAVSKMKDGSLPPVRGTHIFTDEYQDTDQMQLDWLLMHERQGLEITVVADDDQTIYSFRRALGYEGLMRFEQRTQARRVLLEINYRSRSEILAVAAALIRNNIQRVPKTMLSAKGAGGKVFTKAVAGAEQEAALIANAVIADTEQDDDGTYRPAEGRWAVICRNNAGLHMVAAEMRARGIAYLRVAGRDKLPDMARILCQILNSIQTGEALGIEAALTTAGVSDMAIRHLQDAYEDGAPATIHSAHTTNLFRLLDGEIPADMGNIPAEEVKTIKSLARVGRAWRARTAEGFYVDVINGVAEWLRDFTKEHQLRDLEFWAQKLREGRGSLSSRTKRALDYQPPKDSNAVMLHTMHSSKGLEFDRVVIIGCNHGTIPSSKATSIEEERRLLFVAITRAREELTLTYSAATSKSPFLNEIAAPALAA